MKTGKLSDQDLKRIVFKHLPAVSERIIKGPGTGIDCAWWRVKEGLVCISSDPVTGAGKDIGKIAIHVSCNDLACCGIRPEGIMLVIIAPPSCTEDELKNVVESAAATAKTLGVDIAGGHTEISRAVNQIVLITTAFGHTSNSEYIDSTGAKEGDTLLMTKYAALEATSIIACDYRANIANLLTDDEIFQAAELINEISVVKEGVLCGTAGVHAMHDITEGGVLGAVWEMAEASGTGCFVDLSLVQVLPVTAAITNHLRLDPYRLISSGSMLIATDQPEKILEMMRDHGIKCAKIGNLTAKKREYKDIYGHNHELCEPGADELYKLIKKH